jgi:ribosomal protein S18 acetylase RimI-like enzyme
MLLRIARPGDAGAVAALARLAYAKWVPVLGREPLPMHADYAAAIADHRIDLYERDGRLVASLETREGDGHLFVISLAVDPDHQGQGLGHRLLEHADSLALQGGFGEVRLLTNGLMASNVDYYQRHGYEIFERETHETFGIVVHLRKVTGPTPR